MWYIVNWYVKFSCTVEFSIIIFLYFSSNCIEILFLCTLSSSQFWSKYVKVSKLEQIMWYQDNRLTYRLNKGRTGQDGQLETWWMKHILSSCYDLLDHWTPVMLYIQFELLCLCGLNSIFKKSPNKLVNSVLTQFLSTRVAWFWEALLVEAEFMGNSELALSLWALLHHCC